MATTKQAEFQQQFNTKLNRVVTLSNICHLTIVASCCVDISLFICQTLCGGNDAMQCFDKYIWGKQLLVFGV
jgi:hypothetical protein